MKLEKIKSIILLFLISFSIHCAKSELLSDENAVAKIEVPAPKQFVLGKWKFEDEKQGKYFLVFYENNEVVQELYANYSNGQNYNGEINRYIYKINENNEIEIEQNYWTNLVVKKINENEIELKPKVEGGFLSPPILFFFKKFKRVTD